MSTPTKEELPKIAVQLKDELVGEHHLKRATTEVKNPLPSKEDIQSEKTKQAILKGVEQFNAENLKPAETQEKVILPTKEVIEQEKQAAQS